MLEKLDEGTLENFKNDCRKINYKIHLYYKSFKLHYKTKKELHNLSESEESVIVNKIEEYLRLLNVRLSN